MTLADLSPGEESVILRIDEEGDVRLATRLKELGLTEGSRVELVREAPWFHCPIAVRVRGGLLALRRADARRVLLREN